MSVRKRPKGSNPYAAARRENKRAYERHWTKARSKQAHEDAFGKSR